MEQVVGEFYFYHMLLSLWKINLAFPLIYGCLKSSAYQYLLKSDIFVYLRQIKALKLNTNKLKTSRWLNLSVFLQLIASRNHFRDTYPNSSYSSGIIRCIAKSNSSSVSNNPHILVKTLIYWSEWVLEAYAFFPSFDEWFFLHRANSRNVGYVSFIMFTSYRYFLQELRRSNLHKIYL